MRLLTPNFANPVNWYLKKNVNGPKLCKRGQLGEMAKLLERAGGRRNRAGSIKRAPFLFFLVQAQPLFAYFSSFLFVWAWPFLSLFPSSQAQPSIHFPSLSLMSFTIRMSIVLGLNLEPENLIDGNMRFQVSNYAWQVFDSKN